MFAWYGRIAALAVVAVLGSGCVSSTRPHSPSSFHLQLTFRLPAGASSLNLCWAGGLVCVPYGGRSRKNHPCFAIGRINIGISAFGD